jgi:hypothetical protein
VRRAQRRVVEVTSADNAHRRIETAIDDDHLRRRELRQANRLVDQVLVGDRLAAAHPGVGRHHHLGLGVVDARREARCGKAAEHHRVHRADARAGQHGEGGFGDHRHVDEHPVAATDALRQENRREAVHLAMQLAKGVGGALVGLG